jgi:AraC family transcriptional regulator
LAYGNVVQPDDPTATSRSRNWPGLTVDLHAPLYDTDIFAPPNDHHLVIYSRSGGKLLQKRAGRSQHTDIPNGTTVIMPAGCESFWGADWPASARIRFPTELLTDAAAQVGTRAVRTELLNIFEARDLFSECPLAVRSSARPSATSSASTTP